MLSLADKKIKQIYYANSTIAKAYFGQDLVFQEEFDSNYAYIIYSDGAVHRSTSTMKLTQSDALNGHSADEVISAILGSKITWVDDNAFNNCTNLSSVSFSSRINVIKGSAFYNCTSLKTLDIEGDDQEKMLFYNNAFANCTGLETLIIGKTINLMYSGTFSNCTSLKNVTFKGKTISEVKSLAYKYWGFPSGCIITCTDGTITV